MKAHLGFGVIVWSSLSFAAPARAASTAEHERWEAGLELGWQMKGDVDEFLNIVASERSLRTARSKSGSEAVLTILLSMGTQLQKTIGLAQTAVDTYVKNYSHADSARVKACMVSGLVQKDARKGFTLSTTGVELSQAQHFQERFETIYQKSERFRSLLDCSFN